MAPRRGIAVWLIVIGGSCRLFSSIRIAIGEEKVSLSLDLKMGGRSISYLEEKTGKKVEIERLAVAITTQWHKGHESMTKLSRPCLTSFKYKVSALGAMAGGWSFLSVRVLTLLLVLLVSSGGSFGYWTTSSSPAQHSRQNKSLRKDLPNFGEATTTLYRGGQPSKKGFRILAKMGVNIVVDLRGSRDSERKIVTHLGMQYVALPWQCSFPKDKTFAQFLTLLRKNRGKKIFVHCRVGDDRTAMMIASYRMAEEGWSAEKAEREMEKFGFSFTHRRLICPGLSSYEEHFPQRFKTSPAFRDLR